MIGASQRNEDVIRPEYADRILERRERRVVADLGLCLGSRRERLDVAENGAEPLVRLVSRAVGVRGEPLKKADENGRDDEDLRRTLDERS